MELILNDIFFEGPEPLSKLHNPRINCRYKITNSFKILHQNIQCTSTVTAKGTSIKIFHINSLSLLGKLQEVELLLQVQQIDVLCVNEHWLNTNTVNLCQIEGYKIVSNYCRLPHKHGGVLIYAKQDLLVNDLVWIKNLTTESDCEIVGVEVLNPRIFICSVYRSPGRNHETLLSTLDLVCQELAKNNKPIVICGDININYLDKNKKCQDLIEFLNSHGLHMTNKEPTRVSKDSATCIDYIFTNIPKKTIYTWACRACYF